MAENCNGHLQSPTFKKPTSFPKLFTLKPFTETDVVVMSPTSILDNKSFSAFKNPFCPEPKTLEHETRLKLDSPRGIIDALEDTQLNLNVTNSKPETRPILFGSRLRIQIPPLPSSFLTPGSNSPVKKPVIEFGSGPDNPDSPKVFTGCLFASEMELSEDYTCVITHGENPKTTHIFDNCIVESCYGCGGGDCAGGGGGGFSPPAKKVNGSGFPSESFLSFCYTCKKNLGQGKDIYIYRGEKAFCSHECRYQEIMLEEGFNRQEFDDFYCDRD